MLVFCVLAHFLQLLSDMIKNPLQGDTFSASGFKTGDGCARRDWMRGIGVVAVRHQ
ncbi:hypothetical protein FOPG_04701 [Fusarium oxysporum f. sp. conglutinans race 2 54008]|nr:hypothetical protein FOVG_00197 [Fusarium oxysporum f. sp. pisi HDV247]EXL82495.1 hypothetical protein FOPG_04701 [Fusarium oxysporum f. sp. conglutinans race 2 54008]